MKKELRRDLKRIAALTLATSLVLGTNGFCYANNTYAKDVAAVNVASEMAAETEVSTEEIVSEDVPTNAVKEETAVEEIVASESSDTDEIIDSDEVIEIITESEDLNIVEIIEKIAEEDALEEEDASIEECGTEESMLSTMSSDPDEEITFTGDFAVYLKDYFSQEFDDIKRFEKNNPNAFNSFKKLQEDVFPSFEQMQDGKVKKSDVEKITFLEINYENFISDNDVNLGSLTRDQFNNMGLDQLEYFTNLRMLVIDGYPNISGLKVPKKVRYLIIRNCNIKPVQGSSDPEPLDISANTCLRYIDFSNNKYKNSSGAEVPKTIKGLDSSDSLLRRLLYVKIDNSNISSIQLSNMEAKKVKSGGLVFSASECVNLSSVDFGQYKLYGSLNFKHCIGLTTLNINGVTYSGNESIDIRECYNLDNVDIKYDFKKDTDKVKIIANAITKRDGSFTLARQDGSKNGKYEVKAIDDSFIKKAIENYSYLNNGLVSKYETAPGSTSFVVFEQDREKFEKEEVWKEANSSKKRDYGANPIYLYVGQEVKDNHPSFYTSEGDKLDISYSISTNSEGSNSLPITVGDDCKITAVKPGVAYLTVKAGDGSNKEGTQKIIVYPLIDSISVNSSDNITIDKHEKYTISTSMKIADINGEDPSKAVGNILWEVYKKNGNNWESFNDYYTADGLSIAFDQSKNVKNTANRQITNFTTVTIGNQMTGGEFKLTGRVADNNKADGTGITTDYYITVVNVVGQSSDKMGYHFEESSAGFPDHVEFEATVGSDYTLTASINDASKYDGFLKLEQDSTNANKYILSFDNSGVKTTKDFAEFLKNSNYSVSVDTTISKNDGSFSKTYTKEVELAGKFYVTYDAEGASLEAGNPTSYVIPNKYNEGSLNFTKVPVRAGYIFAGWNIAGVKIDSLAGLTLGDITLYTMWRLPSYDPDPTPTPTPTPDPDPTPVEPVKDPEKPTTGEPVKDEKTGGDYVIPDPTKNEVVYKAPPAEETKKTVTIPDKIVVDGKEMEVVKIDPGAFKNNDNVTTINIGKNIETIGAGAFEGASNLTKVTLGNNVETIGSGAFKDCESLKTVTIPSKTTEIGDGAFEGCKSLTSIKLGSSVKEIGDGAFKDCTALKKVTVPAKATEIGDGAFEGCKKLSSVTLGKSVTEIGDGAFKNCTSLKSVTIPSKTKEIGDGAFAGCKSLTSISIGKAVTEIGDGAFEGDKKLKKVTIGKNVEEIGDGAFKDCKSLTSLSIPSKASKIGSGAFEGCSKLTTLKISSKNLTSASIDAGAFSGLTKKTTIKVPKSKLKEYKALFKEKGIDPKVKIKGY